MSFNRTGLLILLSAGCRAMPAGVKNGNYLHESLRFCPWLVVSSVLSDSD